MSRFQALWLVPAAVVAPHWAVAATYLSVEQAQQVLFPGIPLKAGTVRLTEEQKAEIQKRSGARVRSADVQIWRAPDNSVFVVDQVLGKHEFITYAVGIGADGAVKGIEIMEYRESYGYEVRNGRWRAQFVGKQAGAPLAVDVDIRNISGATLSCKHLSEGVRRLLATYEVALRP